MARQADGAGEPASQSAQDAQVEYYWELFLAGYKANDPDSREQFNRAAGLNRRGRRKLEAKARKLRNRHKASA